MEPDQRHVAGALGLADHQLGDIHREAFRNLVRQALDFDRARDHFEQSALHLDARRLAHGVHGDADAMRLVRSMRLKSACSRVPLTGSTCRSTSMTGVVSPPANHQVEDGVVARVAMDDLADVARIDRDTLTGSWNDP
jgi:hypothetical protein